MRRRIGLECLEDRFAPAAPVAAFADSSTASLAQIVRQEYIAVGSDTGASAQIGSQNTAAQAGQHSFTVTAKDAFGNVDLMNGTLFFDGTPGDDCNGHGTHVAGTVGGSQAGVAGGHQQNYLVVTIKDSPPGELTRVADRVDSTAAE